MAGVIANIILRSILLPPQQLLTHVCIARLNTIQIYPTAIWMNISMHMQCKTYNIISVTSIVCKKIMKKNGACGLCSCADRRVYTDCPVPVEAGVGTVSERLINAVLSLLPSRRQTYSSYYRRRDDSHPWPFMQRPGQPWCCSAATVHVPSIVTTGYRDLLYTLMIILAHNIKARLLCRLAKNS